MTSTRVKFLIAITVCSDTDLTGYMDTGKNRIGAGASLAQTFLTFAQLPVIIQALLNIR